PLRFRRPGRWPGTRTTTAMGMTLATKLRTATPPGRRTRAGRARRRIRHDPPRTRGMPTVPTARCSRRCCRSPSFPCRRPPGGSTTAGIRRCAPRGWATCTPAGSAPAGRPSPDTEAFERAPSATFRVQEIQMSSLFRAALRASCLSAAVVAVLCFPLPAVADAPAEAEADADPAADPQMTTLEAVRVSGTRDPNEAERALV